MTPAVQPSDSVASPTTNGNPLYRLTEEQLEELGREFQAIHDEIYADLGEQDASYIRSTIQFHHRLTLLSRILLMAFTEARLDPRHRRAVGGEDHREHWATATT